MPNISLDRRTLLRASLGSAAPLLLGAGAPPPVLRDRTLLASLEPEPAGLVAGISISAPAVVVSANIFEGLVEYDAAGTKPLPCLATSWEESDNGHTVTFHLRPDVAWHDGVPFTSADVQYSVMEVARKFHPRGNATLACVTAVDTPDPYTAVFHLSARSPVFWNVLNGIETTIIPRHLYEGSSPLNNPWTVKPVGTGPFIFKEWARGDHVTLERNPNHWDKERPAYLDRIVFKVIGDPGAREAALETGGVAYAPLSPVPLSDVARVRTLKTLTVDENAFHGSAPMYFFDFNLRRPQFQDLRVRQAFAHAIDRQALADIVWYGLATPATGPVPHYQTQHYERVEPQYEYDPDKAKALLDAAGHTPGSGGARMVIDHVPCAFGEEYVRAGEVLRQQLRRVGVQMNLRNMDLPTYLRVIFTERNFDTQSAWYAAYPDPVIGVTRRYWSKAIKQGTPSSNASGYSSPAMDAVCEGMQTETDPTKRHALVRQLQELAQADLPSVNLLELTFPRVYASGLGGIDPGLWGGYQSLRTIRPAA